VNRSLFVDNSKPTPALSARSPKTKTTPNQNTNTNNFTSQHTLSSERTTTSTEEQTFSASLIINHLASHSKLALPFSQMMSSILSNWLLAALFTLPFVSASSFLPPTDIKVISCSSKFEQLSIRTLFPLGRTRERFSMLTFLTRCSQRRLQRRCSILGRLFRCTRPRNFRRCSYSIRLRPSALSLPKHNNFSTKPPRLV
jgi:hypothetical protein